MGVNVELAARIPHQAVLTGSVTMLAAAAAEGVDMSAADAEAGPAEPPAPGDQRPWLVVVDGGGRRVDVAAAVRVLARRYGVGAVRVDAGGALNGALLRAGLVAEVSVVVASYLVGGGGERPRRLVDGDGADRLALVAVAQLRDNRLWLRCAQCPCRTR